MTVDNTYDANSTSMAPLFVVRDLDQHLHYDDNHVIKRFLAASAQKVTLDYTVLNVVILTLVLILVIEVMRHRLDVWAGSNPFFKTVLELMYRELTTLGIVECVIYLLHKYWQDFNVTYEAVFIDIHFMLFYTAVINAIQSSLVRVLTTRLTNKQWTMTEDIDIYHYVAIRKEFDRIEQQLQFDSNPNTGTSISRLQDSNDGNGLFPENQNYFRNTLNDIALTIRHPFLSSRKKSLIVPVKFHELRAHFIESNNLPQKFKVSPYLNLSLTSVLLEFVQISPAAWILLMASANLLYFLTGAILDATGSVGSITTFMLSVFFTVASLFAIIQFLITLKMKSIFSHIINTKTTWSTRDAVDASTEEEKSREQLNLFWGGAPHLIIVATQYMMFGYAIGLAFIASYYTDLKEGKWITTLLLVWLASFSVFMFMVTRMMPWYTLCTSMGQLVNKERLYQTLAKLKLKEELRKKEAILEELKAEEEMARLKKEEATKTAKLSASKEVKSSPPSKASLIGLRDSLINVGIVVKSTIEGDKRRRRQKSVSDGVQFLRKFNEEDLTLSFPKTNTPQHLSAAAAGKLVSVDEFKEPQIVDIFQGQNIANTILNDTPPPKQTSTVTRKTRHRRRKSLSENVAFMRAMNNADLLSLDTALPPATSESSPRRADTNFSFHSPPFAAPLSPIISPIRTEAQKQREKLELEIQRIEDGLNDHPKLSPDILKQSEELNKLRDQLEVVERRVKLEEEDKTKLINNDENVNKISKQQNIEKFKIDDQTDLSSSFQFHPISPFSTFSRDDSFIRSGLRAPYEDSNAATPKGETKTSEIIDKRQERRRHRRLATRSDGVALMRSSLVDTENLKTNSSLAPVCELRADSHLETLAGLAKVSTKDLPEILPAEKGKRRRSRARLRSASDGVSLMRMSLQPDKDSPVFAEDEEKAKQRSTKPFSVSTGENKASNRVSFSAFHSSSASKVLPSPTDGLSSVDSAASVDGDSDIDDVPDALQVDICSTPSKQKFARPRFDLTSFLQSAKYRAASFLYGPMICLFMIGRVEMFNIQSGVLYDQNHTFSFQLQQAFWVECSWYCLMMLEFVFVFSYFTHQSCRNECKGHQTMKSITAAGWGFLINVTCLALLLVAESQRCCYPSSDGGLTHEALRASYEKVESGESYHHLDKTEICTCMKFGMRMFGGLGKIEPFTCLIMLSPLRFLLATYTLKLFGKGRRREKDDQTAHGSNPKHESQDFDITTKARELWLSTVGIHSDVVAKFGVFSEQCLQCMLGIYSPVQNGADVNEPTSTVNEPVGSDSTIKPTHPKNVERRLDSTSDTPSQPHKRGSPFDFESFGVVFEDFSYPSSRLIRRMRRCERRLLPFLDEWQVVDAVLTSHELVLFDVKEESGFNFSNPEMTNGGKGLRLCDIAKGRKIVSQFDLNDVDFVDIEHRLATEPNTSRDIERGPEQLFEFWQGGNDHIDGYSVCRMNERWCEVNEDRLKIHFKAGGGSTLFLRFVIDLKEMESRKIELGLGKDITDQGIVGRQAKVWCRSIARLRGAMNLSRQNLPHFNEENEIDDFIELCPREEDNQNPNEGNRLRRALLKRNASYVDEQMPTRTKAFDERSLS